MTGAVNSSRGRRGLLLSGLAAAVLLAGTSTASTASAAGASALTFAPPAPYPAGAAGSSPAAVAVGDFNGDGYPDLAVTNDGDDVVSVLINDRGTGFRTWQPYPTGAAYSYPESVAVGDLNGDGHPDLAIADLGTDQVSVLLNNGDGTFQQAVLYAAGNGPVSVAVGDLNGDGLPDLAVANADSGTVSVLLNAGDGSFPSQVTYPAPGVSAVTVADLNGDHRPDLAAGIRTSTTLSAVEVLLNQGAGTFSTQPLVYPTDSYYISSVTAADLNGDGLPDLAAASGGNVYNQGSVSVLLNRGATFAAATTVPTAFNTRSIVAGDFEGDGHPDLAAVYEQYAQVAVLHNNGDGTFASPVTFDTGSSPMSVAVGDVNRDGRPDLVTADANDDAVYVLLNTTPFPTQQSATTVGRWAGADRYATAAAISANTFAPGVPVAYVVAGGAFPDGLSAGAAAAHLGGPVLLTARNSLPPATGTELDRLNTGRVVVLGGPTVVSAAVVADLQSHTAGTVTRLFGPDRYTTATQVALHTFTGLAHTVVIANGENYPDALAAVPLAAANNAPLLLVPHDSVPAAVSAALDQLQPTQILIIGGPASITDTVAATLAAHATVTRIAGADRYATADAVATHLPASTGALIASGVTFPDALAGGAAAAHLRQPLLLAPTTCIQPTSLDHLHGTTDIQLLGGTAALTNDVQELTACG